MRVPIASVVETRDGSLAKDGILTNAFFESIDKMPVVVKRPGCVSSDSGIGGTNGRGIYSTSSLIYAVTDSSIYSVVPGSSHTLLGTLSSSTGQVYYTSTASDTYVFLHDGSHGYTIHNGVFSPITSSGFPSNNGYIANQIVPGAVYLDGSVYVMTTDGKIWGSALEDPTTWDPLDFLTAQNDPDPGVAISKQMNYIVGFGSRTVQFFYDTGTSPGTPLAAADSYTIKTGCANGNSVASLAGSCVWVAQSTEAGRSVMMLNGLSPETISTPAIERVLEEDALVNVKSWCYRSGGHTFYILTLQDSNKTLVYDFSNKTWTTWTYCYPTGATSADVTEYYRNATLQLDSLAYNPNNNEVWVSSSQNLITDPIIVRLNANNGAIVGSIAPGSFANIFTPMVYDAQLKVIWAYDGGGNKLFKFDAVAGTLLNTFTVTGIQGIAINPFNYTLWIKQSSSLVNINKTTGAAISTTGVGFTIYDMAFGRLSSADTNGFIYLTSNTLATNKNLYKFDQTLLTTTLLYTDGSQLTNLAYDDSRNYVWALRNSSTTIGYNLNTNTVAATYTLGVVPNGQVGTFVYDIIHDVLWGSKTTTIAGTKATDGTTYKTFAGLETPVFIQPMSFGLFAIGTNPSTFFNEVIKITFGTPTGACIEGSFFGYFFTSFGTKGYIQDSKGKLYYLSKDTYQDAGQDIHVKGKTPLIDGGDNMRKFWNQITAIGDRLPSSSLCYLSYSDDDYNTFSTPLAVDLSLDKPALYSQGQSRRRAYQWTYTDNFPLRLVGLEVEVTKGS